MVYAHVSNPLISIIFLGELEGVLIAGVITSFDGKIRGIDDIDSIGL
jgi:hypothetical protein